MCSQITLTTTITSCGSQQTDVVANVCMNHIFESACKYVLAHKNTNTHISSLSCVLFVKMKAKKWKMCRAQNEEL